MAREGSASREAALKEGDSEEGEGLLQESQEGSPEDGELEDQAQCAEEIGAAVGRAGQRILPKRQSSFAQHRPHGTPRTQNRVRFDVAERESIERANGHILHPQSPEWMEEEDYLSTHHGRRGSFGQRAPLLTDIEAPTVTLANDIDFDPEDYLESARPKSGLRSAFMNMANSIIGAGIIGQPYAFKQAGLFTGIFLLIALTITVDWTIRLIVTNSKLSGADSFQATMEKCFGKSGLIAISVAQWAFAFGGMVAFCIIIGDTIPRVVASMFPSLYTMPVLWLLTDRRAIIVLFVLGLSYPLSLYRDIAMVSTTTPTNQLMLICYVASESLHSGSDLHDDHHRHSRHPRSDSIPKHSWPAPRQPAHQQRCLPSHWRHILCLRLPSQLSSHLRLVEDTDSGPVCKSHALLNWYQHARVPNDGVRGLLKFWRPHARQRLE